jgi:hypothetical protein
MQPHTLFIDLFPGWTEPGGALVYAPKTEAAKMQVLQAAAWLRAQYPHQCLHALGLAAVGATCVYLVWPAPKPRRRRPSNPPRDNLARVERLLRIADELASLRR